MIKAIFFHSLPRMMLKTNSFFYFSMSRASRWETEEYLGWDEINVNFWNILSSQNVEYMKRSEFLIMLMKSSLKDRWVMRVPRRLKFCIKKYFLAQKLILRTCLKYFYANSGSQVCNSDERLRIWFKVCWWNKFQP